MNIDKFGRRRQGGKVIVDPPGVGFRLTNAGDFDIEGKRLTNLENAYDDSDAVNKRIALTLDEDNTNYSARNKRVVAVANPKNSLDALNLDYYLKTKCNCNMQRLQNVAQPLEKDDAATKKYVDRYVLTLAENIRALKGDIVGNTKDIGEIQTRIEKLGN